MTVFEKSPSLSATSFGSITTRHSQSASMRNVRGCLSVMRTVEASGLSILSIGSHVLASDLEKRSSVNFTSSTVKARPFTGALLCHFTSLRILMTYTPGDGFSAPRREIRDDLQAPGVV